MESRASSKDDLKAGLALGIKIYEYLLNRMVDFNETLCGGNAIVGTSIKYLLTIQVLPF
jgi:hypothetical protein